MEDLAQRLPNDVLADILRRLAPRCVAASRCVCRAWRDVVDARDLLRAELLPLTLAGIFINFHCLDITELFSRPSTNASICGKHDYLPGVRSWSCVLHHCNGLLLIAVDNDRDDLRVLNPATRFCTALPRCPAPVMETDRLHDEYLAYDPAVSPHYQVFSIPRFESKGGRIGDFHYDRFQDLNYYYGKYNKIVDDVEPNMGEESEWSSEASFSDKFEWSSDDHNIDQRRNNNIYKNYREYTEILGFHPKDMVETPRVHKSVAASCGLVPPVDTGFWPQV
ncbi:hypothetical protein PR202_gb11591 [Eleusine coracana subsp. coracana]|uniref:F-box domain-containing protein n=1 Tax=Eleusine coracana subsp. coracana TaxID=191504 RepID=A0AAV5EMW9_ELECO|nr:hypothetical protein PR202_gb11591 [Eleusine coracana subsp. coracana]